MKLAVGMTVTNRPQYLKPVLDSWAGVRGLAELTHFDFHLEPSPSLEDNRKLIADWWYQMEGKMPLSRMIVNDTVLGISENPYQTLAYSFANGAEYAILAEDDLVVSDDILEYHSWTAQAFRSDPEIALVLSFTHDETDPAKVSRTDGFCPWVWGTWWDRWDGFIGAEWDRKQEHHAPNQPGAEVGWDWHLNKRLMPREGAKAIHPHCSRSNSIGIWGAHSNPAVHVVAEHFKTHRVQETFFEA